MEVSPEDGLRKGIPDADAIKYSVQKMLSANPEIYKDGFEKISMWCKAEPAWVIEKGKPPPPPPPPPNESHTLPPLSSFPSTLLYFFTL